jgi:ribosomal protein S18 acetylase RimI-like enzyme
MASSIDHCIHLAIREEEWLRDADGKRVSLDWVCKRKRLLSFINKQLVAFLLYDEDETSIFMHMLWVEPRCRDKLFGTRLMRLFLKENRFKTIVGYANENSIALAKKHGFAIGDINYREIILRPKK